MAIDSHHDWRGWLRSYARLRLDEVAGALKAGSAPPVRSKSKARTQVGDCQLMVSETGESAVGIVDRFVIGSAAEVAEGATPAEIEFDNQLEVILSGLETRFENQAKEAAGEASSPDVEGRKESLQSELWQILHKVRESAELSYAREIDLVELDRRLIFHLRVVGPTVPAGLSTSIGVDKAQVSRSVKRLLELKMVDRAQIRSPIALTRKGETTADRLLRLADLRNRELSFDVGDSELAEFFSVMEILLDRAMVLYEQERERADGSSASDDGPPPSFVMRKRGEKLVIDRSRIVSPLLTLSAYFSRSGALAFKRMTGLSNFEAWVLSEISRDPPTEWSKLVKALERDHSQAGRTVNTLIDKELVKREGRPGRRHGRFSPTEAGQKLYEIIVETSHRRTDYLLDPLPTERRERFLATFDKVRRNAAAQLERERAFEELERR
jgi:DNA-binding MarR family transcriptional regulator